MGLGDKFSQAKDAASSVKENTSSKIKEAKESVSDSVPDSEDIQDLADTAKDQAKLQWRYATTGARHPVRRSRVLAGKARGEPVRLIKGLGVNDPDLLEEIIEETQPTDERRAHYFATISYERFSGDHLTTVVSTYGGKAVEISREVDPKKSYQYGTYGAKAGARYGNYLPLVGGVAPHAGFAFGALLGVADSVDAIEAEDLLSVAEPASDAAEEVLDNSEDTIRDSVFKGSMAFAEAQYGDSSEPDLDEILNMEYDDFANK